MATTRRHPNDRLLAILVKAHSGAILLEPPALVCFPTDEVRPR
jgi:hypothetical protein